MNTSLRQQLPRRALLRGAGVAIGLPLLDVMQKAFAAETKTAPPRRMLAICNNLGVLPNRFFPRVLVGITRHRLI